MMKMIRQAGMCPHGGLEYDGIFLVYSGMQWNSIMEYNLRKIVQMPLRRWRDGDSPSNIHVIDSICSVNPEKMEFSLAHPSSRYRSGAVSPAESVRRQVLGAMGYEIGWKGQKLGVPKAICVVHPFSSGTNSIIEAVESVTKKYDVSFYAIPLSILGGGTPSLPLENVLSHFSIR
jgi:hypothetical protein